MDFRAFRRDQNYWKIVRVDCCSQRAVSVCVCAREKGHDFRDTENVLAGLTSGARGVDMEQLFFRCYCYGSIEFDNLLRSECLIFPLRFLFNGKTVKKCDVLNFFFLCPTAIDS